MSNTITGRIDVTKIDKARLYKGQKGIYLDFVLIPTPNAKYDQTHMVVESVSKEERDQGIKGAILGNATEIIKREQRQTKDQPPAQMERPGFKYDNEDDVPF